VKASRGEIQLPAVLKNLPGLKNLPVPQAVSSCLSALWSLFERVFWKKEGSGALGPASLDLGSAAASASLALRAAAGPDVVSLVEKLPEAVKDPLAEVRELVARVEKMLKEAQALPEVKAAKETRLQHPPLPPSPEPTDVSLPGELPTPAEAPAAQ
jgi:hypothetical protein